MYEIIKVDPVKNRSVVELTIHEGRNHQVKKMFEAVGLQVDKLSRTRFGNLDLTGLRPGEYRKLNKKDISNYIPWLLLSQLKIMTRLLIGLVRFYQKFISLFRPLVATVQLVRLI